GSCTTGIRPAAAELPGHGAFLQRCIVSKQLIMDLIQPELEKYAEQHTSPETELLAAINRDTHAHVLMPRMLSGHLQGRVLAMISRMIRPKAILELGTFTGYSAICFAEG